MRFRSLPMNSRAVIMISLPLAKGLRPLALPVGATLDGRRGRVKRLGRRYGTLSPASHERLVSEANSRVSARGRGPALGPARSRVLQGQALELRRRVGRRRPPG